MREKFQHGLKLFLLYFVIFAPASSAAQEHQWITGGGSRLTSPIGYNAQERVFDITTDEHGNIYVVAELMVEDSLQIDTLTFYAQSGSVRAWRSKSVLLSYDRDGRIRWGKLLESGTNAFFPALVYDGQGGIYIAGTTSAGLYVPRYFGNDTTVVGSYWVNWVIKYDTSGDFQWLRGLGENKVFGHLGSYMGKLLMQDTFIHYIKNVNNSNGVEIMPGVISRRGIYEFVYTPSGELVQALRLPLEDSMLELGFYLPPFIHQPSQSLYLGVYVMSTDPNDTMAMPSGVAVFDRERNLVSLDTFDRAGRRNRSEYAIGFREGDYQYYFGSSYARESVFKGHTMTSPNSRGGLSFLMKTDLDGNLVWKRIIHTLSGSPTRVSTASLGLCKGNILLSGSITESVAVDRDTLLLPPDGRVPLIIIDTTGTVQHMDVMEERDYRPSLNQAWVTVQDGRDFYIGGMVTDSMWGGNSGYMSKGGPSDFFVAKYGYKPDCEPPVSSYTYDTAARAGEPVAFNFTGTASGTDSLVWSFGDGSAGSRQANPVHTFDSGTYRVCAVVYNDCGPTHHCKTVRIRCPDVASSFSYALHEKSISLRYTGSQPLDSVRWDLGNGQHARGLTARHDYERGGKVEVCAIAFRGCGSDTSCMPVIVPCSTPHATFDYRLSGQTLQAAYTGSLPVDGIRWDFGDGATGSGETTSHTYRAEGTYTVCVRPHNECGADTSCRTVKVENQADIGKPPGEGGIAIYPNPAGEYIVIEGGIPGAALEMYDAMGRRRLRHYVKSNREELDVRDFPSGVYLIRMEAGGELLHSRRLVVVH